MIGCLFIWIDLTHENGGAVVLGTEVHMEVPVHLNRMHLRDAQTVKQFKSKVKY